jgi:4-diphosphocytidyl-2-C-methyl-D-erythritol kinase
MQIFFAPAKLNLFLHVVGRRPDGYHLLESAFQLLDLGDDIGIAVRQDGAIVRTTDVPGLPAADDLVVRAARLLQQASGTILGADIAVTKRIPMGGGLGGGSSDAATVLLALNRLWGLDIERPRLGELGLALGADVPFFIFGRNAFARGVGEELQALDLPRRWFVVLAPPCAVPTADIFRAPELTRNSVSVRIEDFSTGAWAFPREAFRNDLEPVACAKYPAVARALAWLRAHDGEASVAARMSGSGACVFAAFDTLEMAEAVCAVRPAECAGFVAVGLALHPMAGFARTA